MRILALSIVLLAADAAPAQTTPDELVERLADFLKNKEDDLAITTIQELEAAWTDLDEKDDKKTRKAILKGIEGTLTRSRKPEDAALHLAAVEAFGEMGEEGAVAAARSVKKKSVKDNPDVLCAALKSVGQGAQLPHIKLLIGFLTHKDGRVIGAAATALAGYHEQKERYRKDIVDKVVRTYASMDASTRGGGQRSRQGGAGGGGAGGGGGGGGGQGGGVGDLGARQAARDKYQLAHSGFETALAALTGQSLRGITKWNEWYRENKKKRWDEED